QAGKELLANFLAGSRAEGGTHDR
ncbi:MAG: hypothetical protein H6Q86_5415, partial [candidate division NC10 bacterium]|nr:hypothetical protein [candidate division NC10 bacterium]